MHFNNDNSDNKGSDGGLDAGRIAWLTTRRILIRLCCFSFFISGGAQASVSEPFLIGVYSLDFYIYCLGLSEV